MECSISLKLNGFMKATRAGNALDPGDPGPNFPFIKAYPLHLK